MTACNNSRNLCKHKYTNTNLKWNLDENSLMPSKHFPEIFLIRCFIIWENICTCLRLITSCLLPCWEKSCLRPQPFTNVALITDNIFIRCPTVSQSETGQMQVINPNKSSTAWQKALLNSSGNSWINISDVLGPMAPCSHRFSAQVQAVNT